MSTPLTQVASNRPEAAEILASPAPHTEVAKRLTQMGHPTTEASVRRWRAKQAWSHSRELAVAELQAPALAGPSLAEQGYLLAEATRPVDLPDYPVSILGCLDQYLGPGQPDLKTKSVRGSDGITTVTITAVRDDVAEMAASLMAARIATGDGDHRCLKRVNDSRAIVYWSPKMRAPLFPGAPLLRYRRFGHALVRKLKTADWELDGNRDYTLAFERQAAIRAASTAIGGEPGLDGLSKHRIRVHLEGL